MGTNSFHMIVCQAIPERDHFDIVTRSKEAVPFFRRALGAHYIDDAAVRAAVRILKDMIKKATSKGASSIIAVATSAVRESRNGNQFLQRIREELDIDARLISGKEEGRLIYLGVLWSMPELADRFAVVDIGGGSCEVMVGDRNQTYFSESYKLGAARLTQRFFRKGIATKDTIKELHGEVTGVLRPAAAKVKDSGGFKRLIGTSGTVQALAKIDQANCGVLHGHLHGWKIPIDRLQKIVVAIEKASLAQEKIDAVSQDRSQTILAGSIVLLEAMRCLPAKEVTVCSAALREGVVVDQLLQTGWLDCALDNHRDPRDTSVFSLLEKYEGSLEHALQVAKLSMDIFEQTKDILHHYGSAEGKLLWSAAMLHDVGMFIGRNGHHKHGYYLIRHAGLLGYSEEEVEIIANIARYHRGSDPKDSHEPYKALPEGAPQMVSDLAAILRLGEALDRSHRQIVIGLKTKLSKVNGDSSRPMFLELSVPPSEDLASELWALSEKKGLFERQFKVTITPQMRTSVVYAVQS
jgi:exopolyphosphatase/guanosine-5'-triphosphate,3'-diphosphate pyrophosphatase